MPIKMLRVSLQLDKQGVDARLFNLHYSGLDQ